MLKIVVKYSLVTSPTGQGSRGCNPLAPSYVIYDITTREFQAVLERQLERMGRVIFLK